MTLPELTVLRRRFILEPQYAEELDSWHTTWLFSCPEGEERFVLCTKDKDRNVVRRECFVNEEAAIDALWVSPPFSSLVGCTRKGKDGTNSA